MEAAEIMPQYPGGRRYPGAIAISEKNRGPSGTVEAGEDVTGKTGFVVNYNDNSQNFIVVKSRGEVLMMKF
jgi:hypothetical protein